MAEFLLFKGVVTSALDEICTLYEKMYELQELTKRTDLEALKYVIVTALPLLVEKPEKKTAIIMSAFNITSLQRGSPNERPFSH